MPDNPVRTHPQDWVKIYSHFAFLYSNKDESSKREMYQHVRRFISELVDAQLAQLRDLQGTTLLSEYIKRWNKSYDFARFLRRVLHHLHRYWIRNNANNLKGDPVRPIDKLLMFYWRENLLTHLHSIIDVALALVDDDRRGLKIDRKLIRGLVNNLVVLGTADDISLPESPVSALVPSPSNSLCHSTLLLYHQLFEGPFVAATLQFYKTHGNVPVDPENMSAFMNSILSQLQEEEERARELLNADSVSRVRQAAQEQLIGNQLEYLQSQVSKLIKSGRYDDLNVVYSLLKRVDDGLTPIRAFFVRHIRAEGNSVVVEHVASLNGKEDVIHSLVLIEKLIQLYLKYASMVRRCFESSSLLLMSIDDAFRGFVNRNMGSLSLPNLLAHYVDHFLRSKRSPASLLPPDALRTVSEVDNKNVSNKQRTSLKSCSANDNNSDDKTSDEVMCMTELVRFFMYLDDKDVFCETHRRLFASRLLTSFDKDLEILFIKRLEKQVGGIYTHRFRGMLQDVKMSESISPKFTEFLENIRKILKSEMPFNTALTVLQSLSPKFALFLTAMQESSKKNEKCGKVEQADDAKASGCTTPSKPKSSEKNPNQWSLNVFVGNRLKSEETGATDVPNDEVKADSATEGRVKTGGTFRQRKGDNTARSDSNEEQYGVSLGELEAIGAESMFEALKLDISVHVLNGLHWPAERSEDLKIPKVLRACHSLFTEFYMRDRAWRNLTWIDKMSTVTLSGRFNGREHLIVASTCQASILLLFNDHKNLSIKEISEHLGISVHETSLQLRPLLFSRRYELLRHIGDSRKNSASTTRKRKRNDEEHGEAIESKTLPAENNENNLNGAGLNKLGNENDEKSISLQRVEVNEDFETSQVNLIIPMSAVRIASVEAEKSRKNVAVDRNTQVDAAIVRIMKMKGEMSHVALYSEVLKVLSSMFLPDSRLIKSRIERLIDMEYMRRDEKDVCYYLYCA